MTDNLSERLLQFAIDNRFVMRKGPLSIAVLVTDHAKTKGLPLDPNDLLTDAGTQVLGAGGQATARILGELGETRSLSREGGRTSRGSVGNMRTYVAFLNELSLGSSVDLGEVQQFWLRQVQNFFAGKPFRIQTDNAKGLRAIVRDLIEQAQARQRENPGTQYAGAVLQHLVGAKLDCALGVGTIVHNSYSTSDDQTGRGGDFTLGDVALHVTTAPSEALIRRCELNLNEDVHPILVTLSRGVTVAEELAVNANLKGRIDIFEIEQFIALNLYELGRFKLEGRKGAISDLVERYNQIIDDAETDPSLKIDLR